MMKLAFALSLCILLSGCGSQMVTNQTKSSGGSISQEFSQPYYDPEVEETAPQSLSQGEIAPAKLVYTGYLEGETTQFETILPQVNELVKSMGGYVSLENINRYGTYPNGYFVIRVPTKDFHQFMEEIGALVHVTHTSTEVEDISMKYYDTQGRLETQQYKLERLQELLAMAENMEDFIALESSISETQWAIDNLSGEMLQYDSLVDFATIEFKLNGVYQYSNVRESPSSFWERLGQSFTQGTTHFAQGCEEFVVSVVYHWLDIILVLVVVFLLWQGKRKNKKKIKFFKPKKKNTDSNIIADDD